MTTLFDDFADKRSIAQRFAEFDAEHPEVYEAFVRFANELRRNGHQRGSSQQIIERIRWESLVNEQRTGGFKVNNWFRTMYAKKLVEADPRFQGFFEFRIRRTA